MKIEQLTFWDGPLLEAKSVWQEIYEIKEKQNNIRRGLFSRHEHMKTEVCSLKKELHEIRDYINSLKEINLINEIQIRA